MNQRPKDHKPSPSAISNSRSPLSARSNARTAVSIFAIVAAIGLLLPTYEAQAGFWKYVWLGITGVASIIGGAWTVTEVVNGPGDITGQVNARPQLHDPTITIEGTSAFHGSVLGTGPHGYTNIRGEYEYHDYTFTFVSWDPDAEEYLQGEQHRTSGDSFMDQSEFESRITATREPSGWWQYEFTSPGAWIVTGRSRRYTCGPHTVQSNISGGWFRNPDGDLADAATALNYRYAVRLHFDRKKMKWDPINHQWKDEPWRSHVESKTDVNATSNSQWTVDIVPPDTQVTSERVSGGSDIYWSEIQSHSTIMVPMEYYDDHGLPTGRTRLVSVPKITKTYLPKQYNR